MEEAESVSEYRNSEEDACGVVLGPSLNGGEPSEASFMLVWFGATSVLYGKGGIWRGV